MFYAVLFFATLIICFLIADIIKPKNFPPGPRWYPILGSALQISKLRIKHGLFCKVIEELNKFYDSNGTIGLKIGKDKLVIVNTADSIKEMMTNEDLDGKPVGLFYAARTFGRRMGILLTDEEVWQEQRRFIERHLKDFGFAKRDMANMIQNEAIYLVNDLRDIINREGDGKSTVLCMQELYQISVLNTLWSMMAGVRYERGNKEIKEIMEMFYELFKNVDMIGCLFSHFPFLRFVAPDFSGYSYFVDIHRRLYEFMGKEVEKHKKTFCPTDDPRDLMDKYLQVLAMPTDEIKKSFSEQQLLAVCLDMFLAGSETTNKSLGFAFLHLVRNIKIQEKAQAELDAVVGRERLPTWDDRSNLPYCEAILYEALRIFMGHTFGIPHRALKDTRLCGFNIPKDTMVISCFRGMLMEEQNFPNPNKFDPERFLVNNKLVIPESFAPFGLGKHRCMGQLMARQNLFIFITTLIQNFRFLPLDGKLPDDEPDDGATASVKRYMSMIVKR